MAGTAQGPSEKRHQLLRDKNWPNKGEVSLGKMPRWLVVKHHNKFKLSIQRLFCKDTPRTTTNKVEINMAG